MTEISLSDQGENTKRPWRVAMGGLADAMGAQRAHYALWLPVMLGAGICLYFGLAREPSPVMTAAIVAGPVALWWRQWQRARCGDGRAMARMLIFGLIAMIGVGFGAAQLRTHIVAGPILEKPIRAAEISGRILSIELLEDGKGSRAVLDRVTIEDLPADQTPHRIRINIRKDEGLRPGQAISVLAGLNPPSPPVAPGSFDFQRHSFFKQLGAYGFAFRAPVIVAEPPGGLNAGLEQYRLMLARAATAHVPAPESAVVIALLTGERAAMSEELWEDVRTAGLAHIIAISGMNIGMAAGAAFFLSRFLMALFPRFALYHPIKSYAAVIAFIAAFVYALIVGMSVPTFRALIMTGLFLLAIGLNRSPFSMRLAAFSALGLLLFFPDVLLGASFQMSFAAVMGLIWFYDITRNWWVSAYTKAAWWQRCILYLGGVCVTTVLATIVTAPFSLYHFQQIATYGVAANFIVVPLASFVIMPLAILVYFLAPLGLADWPLRGMAWGVDIMLDVARMVSAWPHAVMHWPVWPGAVLGLVTGGILFMTIWSGRGRWLGFAPLLLGFALLALVRPPDILVSSTGKLWALRGDDGRFFLSSRVADRFVAEAWIQESGRAPDSAEKIPAEGPDGPLRCDADACRAEIRGRKIAFVERSAALAADCAWADIVVSRIPVEGGCAAGHVIDRFDVWRNGSYAIWLDDGGPPRIEHVRGTRGDRPWTVTPKR